MIARQILEDVLAERGLTWSENEKAIVARVLRDSANLGVREASGGGVSAQDWAQVKAHYAQIAAIAELRVTSVVPVVLKRLSTWLLDLAFARIGLPAA